MKQCDLNKSWHSTLSLIFPKIARALRWVGWTPAAATSLPADQIHPSIPVRHARSISFTIRMKNHNKIGTIRWRVMEKPSRLCWRCTLYSVIIRNWDGTFEFTAAAEWFDSSINSWFFSLFWSFQSVQSNWNKYTSSLPCCFPSGNLSFFIFPCSLVYIKR